MLEAELVGSGCKATSFPPQEWGRGGEKTRAEEESFLPPKGMSGQETVCHWGPAIHLHSLYSLSILEFTWEFSGAPIAQRWVVSGHDGGDFTSTSLFLGASRAFLFVGAGKSWRRNTEQRGRWWRLPPTTASRFSPCLHPYGCWTHPWHHHLLLEGPQISLTHPLPLWCQGKSSSLYSKLEWASQIQIVLKILLRLLSL